jgi:sugar O-acyltransferase (sialic acid O-acetyltransferase NeuD family)
MKKRAVILCAGYHAHVVTEILRCREDCELIGILDDNRQLHNTVRNGYAILGGVSLLRELWDAGRVDSAILGLGNISMLRPRVEIYEKARSLGVEMIQAIHPTAFVSPSALCGPGLFLGPHAVINTGVKLGENIVVYTGSTIDHDSEIKDHVFISPGVRTAGQVLIERGVYIGPGAIICSGCVIGEESVIGAGAVVKNDIPCGKLAFGVPARVQKSVQEWRKKFCETK